MVEARTLWHIDKTKSVLRTELIPDEGGPVLKNCFSMVSGGTERTVALGKVPESMYSRMAVPHMKGGFDFPMSYGYSCVARDIDGNTYHVMHPHSDYLLPEKDRLFKIEVAGIPLSRYALISNMETIVNAIWDGDLEEGVRIAIIGAGNIGCMLAIVLKYGMGFQVDISDVDQNRLNLLRNLGFDTNLGANYQRIFHTSGSSQGLQQAIDLAGMDARIIELSWYGVQETNLQLGENFHYNRVCIQASQVSHIPAKMQDKWSFHNRKAHAIDLIEQLPQLDDLIEMYPFSKAEELYQRLRFGPGFDKPIQVFEYTKA